MFWQNVHPGPCGDDPCWLVVFKWLKPYLVQASSTTHVIIQVVITNGSGVNVSCGGSNMASAHVMSLWFVDSTLPSSSMVIPPDHLFWKKRWYVSMSYSKVTLCRIKTLWHLDTEVPWHLSLLFGASCRIVWFQSFPSLRTSGRWEASRNTDPHGIKRCIEEEVLSRA